MKFLDTFRVLEKTTVSGSKKYIPQVMEYKRTITKGILWWEKSYEKEQWDSFYYDSLDEEKLKYIMSVYTDGICKELTFDTLEEAEKIIDEFRIVHKQRLKFYSDTIFTDDVKVIKIDR